MSGEATEKHASEHCCNTRVPVREMLMLSFVCAMLCRECPPRPRLPLEYTPWSTTYTLLFSILHLRSLVRRFSSQGAQAIRSPPHGCSKEIPGAHFRASPSLSVPRRFFFARAYFVHLRHTHFPLSASGLTVHPCTDGWRNLRRFKQRAFLQDPGPVS